VIRSQACSDEWDAATLENQDDGAAGYRDQGEEKEQPTVIHHYDSEDGEMTNDCARKDTDRDRRAQPVKAGHEKQNRGNQFDYARPDPTPRFEPDLGEDVNRFGRAGEFEEQGLKKNNGREDSAPEGDDSLRLGE
jgi:hypothetical protein